MTRNINFQILNEMIYILRVWRDSKKNFRGYETSTLHFDHDRKFLLLGHRIITTEPYIRQDTLRIYQS